ncbi:MAG: DnaB-like helicase N-terminal domain-containing protein [Planctomycetota bacterium]|jgi:replicative DNA helicase
MATKESLEAAIAGALMIDPDPDLIRRVNTAMRDYKFTNVKFMHIFNAVVTIWAWGRKIDAVSVRDELQHQGVLDEVGVESIARVLEAVPSSADAMLYVTKLLEM